MDSLDSRVAAGRTGDRSALTALIAEYERPIAAFVLRELRSEGEESHTEDVAQQTFVKMVLTLPRLRDAATFEGWLFQIARNTCRDHLRRQRWRRRLFSVFAGKHEEVAAIEPMEERAPGDLERALAALDADDQTLLRLSLERPRSYRELASLMGISVGATKSRLFRSRARLGKILKEGGARG